MQAEKRGDDKRCGSFSDPSLELIEGPGSIVLEAFTFRVELQSGIPLDVLCSADVPLGGVFAVDFSNRDVSLDGYGQISPCYRSPSARMGGKKKSERTGC